MILILSHRADEHANEVVRRLQRERANVLLFDTARFPRETNLLINQEVGRDPQFRATLDGKTHDMTDVRAVWWRRPQPFTLDAALSQPHDRTFAYGECQAAISGLWACLNTAHWVNNPEKDEVAARKLYQLKVAAELGLAIPRTLVTNDPAAARAFVAEQGERGTIYKAFSATEQAWRETRLLQPDEHIYLEAVQYAPVIFQEYVRADIDLRITVIGDEFFPAEIHSGQTDYKVDFRMTINDATVRAHTLPDEVVQKLRLLMQRLGLIYGAIDMRLTPAGEYVFLEVNPSGQWLFIEGRTQQPITSAFVNYLQHHN